jgi:hypothetical protein
MNDTWLKILTMAVEFIVGAALVYGIGLVKTKIGEAEFNKYAKYVLEAVQAVEQIIGAGNGTAKKDAVVEYIVAKFGDKISKEDLNILIEAAVKKMNAVWKQQGADKSTPASQGE